MQLFIPLPYHIRISDRSLDQKSVLSNTPRTRRRGKPNKPSIHKLCDCGPLPPFSAAAADDDDGPTEILAASFLALAAALTWA